MDWQLPSREWLMPWSRLSVNPGSAQWSSPLFPLLFSPIPSSSVASPPGLLSILPASFNHFECPLCCLCYTRVVSFHYFFQGEDGFFRVRAFGNNEAES